MHAAIGVVSNHGGLVNSREAGEHRFNLSQFHAVATDLYLMVNAAQAIDGAVGQITSKVAGAIDSSSGSGAERMGQETFGSEVRAAKVAASQSGAGHVDFTSYTNRNRP